jgi:hypothetical protein
MGFVQSIFFGAILGFVGCLYYLAAAKRKRAARDGDAAVKGVCSPRIDHSHVS